MASLISGETTHLSSAGLKLALAGLARQGHISLIASLAAQVYSPGVEWAWGEGPTVWRTSSPERPLFARRHCFGVGVGVKPREVWRLCGRGVARSHSLGHAKGAPVCMAAMRAGRTCSCVKPEGDSAMQPWWRIHSHGGTVTGTSTHGRAVAPSQRGAVHASRTRPTGTSRGDQHWDPANWNVPWQPCLALGAHIQSPHIHRVPFPSVPSSPPRPDQSSSARLHACASTPSSVSRTPHRMCIILYCRLCLPLVTRSSWPVTDSP